MPAREVAQLFKLYSFTAVNDNLVPSSSQPSGLDRYNVLLVSAVHAHMNDFYAIRGPS